MPTPDKMEQDFDEDDFYDWCSMELLFAWIDLTARGALLLVFSVMLIMDCPLASVRSLSARIGRWREVLNCSFQEARFGRKFPIFPACF